MPDSPFGPAVIWHRGKRYEFQWLVTNDGRFVYRHADTRAPFVYAVVDDEWDLVPLESGIDLFEFDSYLSILRLLRE